MLRHGDEPVRVRRVSVVRLALALRHGDCPFESWSDELFACSDEQRGYGMIKTVGVENKTSIHCTFAKN